MWRFLQSYFWHERTGPGRTTVTGCSDAFFTITAAWYIGAVGACHVLFLPCFANMELVACAGATLVGLVLLLAFFDRFHLEIEPNGYRLRYYRFGILLRHDVFLPPDTCFSLFDPDWDPEASHFALGFFERGNLKNITWLVCFQAEVAEERLRKIAKMYNLSASESVSQHEPT